jgi:anti-anti-sigma factor
VLAAVVVVAVAGFVSPADFKRLWRISRLEFYVALVAFVAVLLVGILKGVMISAIVSILFLLRLLAKPHVAVLGRIPGTIRFSDAARHTSNELFPGLLLFRVEAPLLYFNVETIFATVIGYVQIQAPPVRMVVCDLSTSPYIDASGARMLARLVEQLEKWGIQFRVAEAHAEVREILRATGFSESLGGVSRHIALADIVEDFERDAKRRNARLEAQPKSAMTNQTD